MNDRPCDAARRAFLRRSLMLAGTPCLLLAMPARAFGDRSRSTSSTTSGSAGAIVDVRDKGARGDGHSDDTSAIQAAIDALSSTGGTVTVPAGEYMIDATRSIELRSNVHLQLADGARLRAIPNGLKRYYIVKVRRADNVQISGGEVVGERKGHTGQGGEWGFGIDIRASRNVTVRDVHISECWGDGMWIGALGKGPSAELSSDVTLQGVVSTNNRRQGLSIGPSQRVRIIGCTFSDTHGTAPQAGIDLEPQAQGPVSDVLIEDCTITGNHGSGIECHHNVSGLTVRNCTIRDNRGNGVLLLNAQDLSVLGNTIEDNGMMGVVVAKRAQGVRIAGNTLSGNNGRHLHQLLKSLGTPGGVQQHGQMRIDPSTSRVQIDDNTFSS